MASRRNVVGFGLAAALLAPLRAGAAAENCPAGAAAETIGAALLEKYVAAVNAHDVDAVPEFTAETYIQHSGRSPSGLPAQIENFRRIFAAMPDLRMQVEEHIIAGDRVVARNTFSATHTR